MQSLLWEKEDFVMSSSRILNTSEHFEMLSHDLSKTMTALIKAAGCAFSSRRVGGHKCSRTSTKVLSELLGCGCNGWRPVAYPFGTVLTVTGDSAAREAKFSWIFATQTQANHHFMASLMKKDNSWAFGFLQISFFTGWLKTRLTRDFVHVLSSVTSCWFFRAFLSIYNDLINPLRNSPPAIILIQEQ